METISLCRICLKSSLNGVSLDNSLSNSKVWHWISEIASIPKENNSNFPQQVCQNCYLNLEKAVELRKQIIESNSKLIEMKDTMTVLVPKEEPMDDGVEIKNEPVEDFLDVKEEPPWENDLEVQDQRLQTSKFSDDEETTDAFDSLSKDTQKHYKSTYDDFVLWCQDRNYPLQNISNQNLLAYFQSRSITYKVSTLWGIHAHLMKMLPLMNGNKKYNFDLVKEFLKGRKDPEEPNRAAVFTRQNILLFLENAPDDKYLMMKVLTVIGIFGVCRIKELYNLRKRDLIVQDDAIVVHIFGVKKRTFTIKDKGYQDLIKRYMALRPVVCCHESFFIGYYRGKCVTKPAGMNYLNSIPSQIAKFLLLQDPSRFTGLSLYQTARNYCFVNLKI